MDYKKSLEEVEKTLNELKEENKVIPILVEGDKDVEALRKLEINGEILVINAGMSISNLCDKIAQEYKDIILLTDWDRKGGFLCHTIRKNLEGRVNCNTRYRKVFAKNTMIRKVEGLPSWIETMSKKLNFF